MGVLNAKPDPLDSWDNLPLSHARIGYKNLLTATTTPAAAPAITPNTWSRWRPSAGAFSVKFQLAAAALVDYIAIAAHSFFGVSIEFSYATTVGGSLTPFTVVTPNSNRAIMYLLPTPITMAEIQISGTLAAAAELGVLHAGRALQMYQPIYGGHSPIDLNAKTEYQSNMSETGQFLGRNITRQGTETTFNWRHLDPGWYRSRFQPFVDSAKRLPFFIKWRPDLYDDAAYCYTTGDLSPSNMGGGHRLMSVSMQVRGHDDP